MKLPEAVQAGAEAKVQAEMKPVQEKLARLKATLEAYETHVKVDVERRISNAILVALGMPEAPEDPALAVVAKELKTSLGDVASLVGVMDIPEVVAESPPSAPPPSVPTSPPTPRPPRKLVPEDVATAEKLLAEIEALRPEIKTHHHTRLHPLLQAITAEIKMLQGRIPQDHYLFDRLGKAIGAVNAMRVEGKVDSYIKGLAFGSQGDWERIAHRNRRKVDEFDRDAAKEPAPGSLGAKLKAATAKAKAKAAEPKPETTHQWPGWPTLRCLQKPILLAGGMLVPEKIQSVYERFGLTVEWHEIDHDNPRASNSLVARIRGGKVGAIVLLEGVMRHDTYKPVVAACNVNNVPYAMGDKAGILSLTNAFADIERQLQG